MGSKTQTGAARSRVQVRTHGKVRELWIDETFASRYRVGSAVTGPVWDALAAPLLLLPPEQRRHILVLGLGGGSVARVARALAPQAHIVGVERDGEVIRMARRWFDLDALGVEVIDADARALLVHEQRRFDAVLEDVFVGRGDAVCKPHWLPRPGLKMATRCLTPGGLLVSNAIDATEAVAVRRAMTELHPGAVEIRIRGYCNHVIAAGPPQVTAWRLRRALATDPTLAPTLGNFSFRTLRPAPPEPTKMARRAPSGKSC